MITTYQLRNFLKSNLPIRDIDWSTVSDFQDLIDDLKLSAREFSFLINRVSLRYNIIIPHKEWINLTNLNNIKTIISESNPPRDEKGKEYLLLLRQFYNDNSELMENGHVPIFI